MTIGALTISLEASIAQFTSSMDKAAAIAEQRMQQIDKALGIVKTSLAAVGAAAAVGLTLDAVKAKIEGAIQAAAGLQELAERTGSTAERLSGLGAVAKLSNTDTESLATGLQKLSKQMVDMQEGGKKSEAAFNAIGIGVKDLKGLKPDEAFLLISQRMNEYANGAEKTAIAQALFGKSGANLLPVMRDVAEVGDLQVKLTDKQIATANEYERNLRRLEAAQGAVYKVIAFQVVPVMDAFAKTMLESATRTDGLRGAVDDLARKGSITEWAQNGAIALSYIAESVLGLIKLAGALGGSFQAVFADIKAAGAIAYLGPQSLFSDDKRAQLKAVLDERNKTVEDANKRYVDLWNYNGTALSSGLKSTFDIMNQGAGGGRGSGSDVLRLDRNKPPPNYHPPTGNGPADDPARAQLEGVLKQQALLIAESEKQYSTYSAYLKDFYSQQYYTAAENYANQDALIATDLATKLKAYDVEAAAAKQYLAHEQAIGNQVGQQKAANDILDIATKRTEALTEAQKRQVANVMAFAKPLREFELALQGIAHGYELDNAQAQFQIDMLGRGTLEVQKLTKAREIDLQLQQKIYEITHDKGYTPGAITQQVADATAKAEAQKLAAAELVTTAYNKQRDALFGAAEALRKYSEDASNAGAQVSQVITDSLKGLEDMLVTFFTTGKLSWQSLEQTIVSGIMRIIVQEQMIKPLADYLNGGLTSGTGGGGLLGGFLKTLGIGGSANAAGGAASAGFGTGAGFGNQDFGGYFADGGYLEPGKWGWAGENGPEPIYGGASGVTVFPNEQAIGGDGRSLQVINHFAITGPVDQRTQQQIAAAAGASVQRALARNG